MALTEPQIQRYSRQILLKEIGGVGQVRLLSSAIAVDAAGPAFETAAVYLAAGGSPVRLRGAWLEGFDPELDPTAPLVVQLSDGPGDGTPVAQVVIGTEAAGTVIAFRAADGCRACLAQTCSGLGRAPADVRSTAAGTLAALLCQKLVLGQLGGSGALHLDGAATVTRRPLPPCAACALPR